METLNIKKYIPNILTITRIFLVIPITIFMMIPTISNAYIYRIDNNNFSISINMIIAGVIFIVASISDWLDGYLSRKYNWTSNFGKFWDPLADKILVNTVLIMFAVCNYTHAAFVILFVIRDIIIDGLRMLASQKNIIVAADYLGKIKTVLQIIAIIVLFFVGTPNTSLTWWYWGVLNLMIYTSLLLSLIAGINYGINFVKMSKNN